MSAAASSTLSTPPPLQQPTPAAIALTKGEHKTGLGRKVLLAVFGVIALVVIMKESNDTTAKNGSSAAPVQSVVAKVAPKLIMPNDQVAVVAVVEGAAQSYRSAGSNELQAGSTRPARASALCDALRGTTVRNWTGTISKLSTNGDGKGVISIKIAPDIVVATWNNAFSDIGDQTLLEPSSQIYRTALGLKQGQAVTFSGSFFRTSSDCVKESSLTLHGSMTSPNFIFRFSEISPL